MFETLSIKENKKDFLKIYLSDLTHVKKITNIDDYMKKLKLTKEKVSSTKLTMPFPLYSYSVNILLSRNLYQHKCDYKSMF